MGASEAHIAAFLSVAGETLNTVETVLDDLDDDTVNATPPADGVNSVFALVTHVGGALGFWGGSFLAGEDIPRDRDSEFRASGTVEQARAIIDGLRTDLPRWANHAATGIRNRSARGTTRTDFESVTEEWVLTHMLRELTQHTGHMEICRDLVRGSLPDGED